MSKFRKKKLNKFLITALAATVISYLPFTGGENLIFAAETVADDVQTQDTALVMGVSDEVTKKIFPFSVEARFFSPHFNANVKSDKISYNGGSVNLKDDLGFGNNNAPEIILRYKRFTMDYFCVKGSGDKTFSGRDVLTFGGSRYRGTVNSDSELHYLKLNITNPIISKLGTGLDWSYGITGMYWKGSVDGQDIRGRHESRSEEYAVPIPTLGIGVHTELLPELKAYANISGLYAGHYGHFYDFEAGIRYNPTERFGITAGYRKIDVKVEHKNDHGKMTLNGPFAGLRFDF